MFPTLLSQLLKFLKLFRGQDRLQFLSRILANGLDLLMLLLFIKARVGTECLDLFFGALQDRMDFGFLFRGEVQFFEGMRLSGLVAFGVLS